jgi:hypothetical protein
VLRRLQLSRLLKFEHCWQVVLKNAHECSHDLFLVSLASTTYSLFTCSVRTHVMLAVVLAVCASSKWHASSSSDAFSCCLHAQYDTPAGFCICACLCLCSVNSSSVCCGCPLQSLVHLPGIDS